MVRYIILSKLLLSCINFLRSFILYTMLYVSIDRIYYGIILLLPCVGPSFFGNSLSYHMIFGLWFYFVMLHHEYLLIKSP
ncbi:hypothetical protein BDA99DRAFT_525771 [Phascolomyces articulosus]|uniref:Uncharacterized protein n=1 Tax=Phascolomyces articulosus TaxID=60185 RepID=A0AAD5P8L6_9FUNG|nr:hypothetical protein BDA99DRAFT_525771 [Phascolomyces articulosus]